MSLFEKQKFENKDMVPQLREEFNEKAINFADMPKDVLVELLEIAVWKIDELENGGEYDERDAMDQLCDAEFIVDDLFAELEERIESDCYE